MTHVALKDELLDAQTLRAVGVAPYGGADIGECLVAAGAVRGTDLTSWHWAWTSTASAEHRLVEELTCEKQYLHFTVAEGAGDHCEAGARTLYHARSFGWLDSLLQPSDRRLRGAV
jgi:hypothetical protein